MWHYKLGCWIDDRWLALMLRWDPDRHPVLFYVGTVPLTTWFRHPRDGAESVRHHVTATQFDREIGKWK